LGLRKRDDEHKKAWWAFPKGKKKQEQTQNYSLIWDQRSFLLYPMLFFNNANVIEASVFCKEGLKPN
jgi:hypothetical protein